MHLAALHGSHGGLCHHQPDVVRSRRPDGSLRPAARKVRHGWVPLEERGADPATLLAALTGQQHHGAATALSALLAATSAANDELPRTAVTAVLDASLAPNMLLSGTALPAAPACNMRQKKNRAARPAFSYAKQLAATTSLLHAKVLNDGGRCVAVRMDELQSLLEAGGRLDGLIESYPLVHAAAAQGQADSLVRHPTNMDCNPTRRWPLSPRIAIKRAS